MKIRRLVIITAVFFPILAFPAATWGRGIAEDDEMLTVGAIQFSVSEETYSSAASFRAAVTEALEKIEGQAAASESHLDLVVFPEYTSAFLGLSVMDPGEVEALLANPAARRGQISEAVMATHWDMMDIWMDLSSEKPYAILAGTHLMTDSMGRIHNRALLFRDGEVAWTQDKVFPGAPEKAILGLGEGRVEDARPFTVDGFRVVVTICRDTYSEEWEKSLPDADLWIDIKANELPYTMEYYDGALASRLPDSAIDRGLTVSLSGEILGFRFTGPIEYLYNEGPIAGTDPWAENSVMIIELPVSD